MNELKINHLAILVCVAIMFGLGFLWFGTLFGAQWMSMVGLDMETARNNPPGAGVWITNLVSAVAPLYVLAWLFTKLNVTSGARGAGIGLVISFAFHHLSTMNNNMFAGDPYALAWITGGYSLVAMTISGFVLGAWTKKAS
jgi:hypothetical protein